MNILTKELKENASKGCCYCCCCCYMARDGDFHTVHQTQAVPPNITKKITGHIPNNRA